MRERMRGMERDVWFNLNLITPKAQLLNVMPLRARGCQPMIFWAGHSLVPIPPACINLLTQRQLFPGISSIISIFLYFSRLRNTSVGSAYFMSLNHESSYKGDGRSGV